MRIARVEGRFVPTEDGKSASGARGIVATAHPEATQAGIEMLSLGGNAIDAACAAGLALGVCEPQASGIGGQSLGLVHFEGRTFAVDGSSRAPSLAHIERIEKGEERLGHRATTVPSTLATYAWLSEHYGRLPWSEVLQPSIRIAREGYAITELQHTLQNQSLAAFESEPSSSGARYFLGADNTPLSVGHLFRQPDLAEVFSAVADRGVEEFYLGDIAAQIDDDMKRNDGFLRRDDLALIPWPIERRVLSRRYRGYLVSSMPPPGAGRTLLLVLMILGNLRSGFLGGSSLERHHFVSEAFRKAFLTRKDRPFDPNTYPQIPEKTMMSRAFAAELAHSIAGEMDATLPLKDPPGENADTTHFAVMDEAGNAVTMTQSVELVYGSKAAADGLGFLYNNYMSALETSSPAHPYYLRPNAIPWSSAAPTIVFRRGKPWLALGSPGSERIFSTVAQVLMHVIDGSRTLTEAMEAPRLHCSIGGRVSLEADRFDSAVGEYLESMGYEVDPRDQYAFYLGCAQAVLKRQTGEGFQGVADVRRDGTAAGLD